MLLRVSKHSR